MKKQLLTLLVGLCLGKSALHAQTTPHVMSAQSTVQTGQQLVFYDNGGATENVGTQPLVSTFLGTGQYMEIYFTDFQIPADAILKIYKGTSTSSELIGAFTNGQKPWNFKAKHFTVEYVPSPSGATAPGWRGIVHELNAENLWAKATMPESDCINAIPLCSNSTVNTSANQYDNTGAVNDDSGGCYSGTGSGGSVWYSFTPQANGPLDFAIAPTGSTDYDFVLWDITNGCNNRTELSCNYSATHGTTGLNSSGSTNSQDASGTLFNSRVNVDVTRRYAICINYYSGNNAGFTLTFKNEASSVNIIDNVPPTITNAYGNSCSSANTLEVYFSEWMDCATLQNSDFTIAGHTVTVLTNNCSGGTPSKTNHITLSVSPALAGPGTYTLQGQTFNDLCGNALNSNYSLVFNTPPTPNAGADRIICRSPGFLGIGFTYSPNPLAITASGGTGYYWSDGQSGATINVAPTTNTTYTVTVTNGACPGTDQMNVVIEDTPRPNLGADLSICDGAPITLNASGGGTYQWQVQTGTNLFGQPTFGNIGGATASSLTTTPTPFGGGTTTNYQVNVLSPSGACSGSDVLRVTFNPSPAASAGANQGICVGGSCVLGGSTDGSSVVWSPATGLSCTNCLTPTATPSATTTYTLTATGANGCTRSANVTVTVQDGATSVISGPASVCSGNTAAFTSTNLNAGSAPTYQWFLNGSPIAGATSATLTTGALASTGSYHLVVTPGGVGQCNNNPVMSNVVTVLVGTCANITTTSTTYTSCSGSIFDNGGAGGNYSDGNATYSLIINPGQPFSLTFSQFALFNDPDQVRLYNCNTAGCTANQIGGAFQTTNSPGTVTINNNNGLRVVFQVTNSNFLFNDAAAGFAASWSVAPLSCPASISGSASININTTGNTYSIAPVPGATSYIWTVPAGTTIASGQGTTSITLNAGPTGTAGLVSVTAINGCNPSCTVSLPLTVNTVVLMATELLDFRAECLGAKTRLSWSFDQSESIEYMAVEQSVNGAEFWDGVLVNAQGGQASYQAALPIVAAEGYYRLRWHEWDGSVSYSPIIQQTCDAVEENDIVLYPNPTQQDVTVRVHFNQATLLEVEVLDVLGRAVYAQSVSLESGVQEWQIPTHSLPAAVYLVRLQDAAQQMSPQLIRLVKN